jgi:hypothetical protein
MRMSAVRLEGREDDPFLSAAPLLQPEWGFRAFCGVAGSSRPFEPFSGPRITVHKNHSNSEYSDY